MAEALEAVPVTGVVELAATVAHLAANQQAYHDACNKLLDANDYQDIGDRSFVKKSGWRKLAVAYNVSCEVLTEEFKLNEAGHIIRAKYVVRATAPNGRHMDGVGLCDLSERKFSKPDHDIPATAHTRATNRACADLFGLGAVSAEEVDFADAAPAAAIPAKATPTTIVAAGRREVGTTALLARVANLDDAEKAEFDAHVAQMNWPWPPTSGAVIRQAEKYLDNLEEDQ